MSLVAIFQRRSAHTQSPRIKIRRRLLGRNAPIAALGVAAGLLSFGMVFAPTAHASTYTWDGTVNDWFASPLHWVSANPGTFPGTTDDAKNFTTAAMTLGSSTTIQSFFSSGGFSLNGGTFSGSLANAAGTLTVNNVFTDNGGTINNFTVNQGTGGSVVFGTSGGNVANSDIFNANVDMSSASAYLRLANTNMFNGNLALGASGGNGLHLQDGSSNFVLNGNLTGFGGVVQDNGGATFTNNGTVNANSAAQTLNINTDHYNNAGTTEATNGSTLTLAANVTITDSGNIIASGANSIVSIAGALTGSGSNLFTAANGGQIQINGASLLGTINEAVGTSLVFNTSGNNILNNTTVNGNLDLATDPTAYLRIVNTDTLNGNLALGASGGNGLHLQDVNSNFVLNGNLTGFGGVVQDNGGATFTNNGTVNANSAAQTLNINTDHYNNAGTTEATNGSTLTLAANVTTTNTGKLIATGGGILDISGLLNSNTGNSINSVGGTVNILGATLLGTVNETAGSKLVFNTSGNNILNNTTVNGNLDLATDPTAYLRIVNTDTLNGNLALGASGGNGLHLQDVNSNFVLNGNLTGFGGVVQDNGGATFTNNGTVNANSAAQTLNINTDHYNNAGTTEATNGSTLTLAANVTITDSGNIIASGANSIVSIAGALTGSGSNLFTAANGGQIQINGASLLGTINEAVGTSLVFNTSGNNILNNTTVNGNLDLSGSTAYLRLINTDTLNGNLALGASGGNGLHLQDGSSNFVLNGNLTGFGGVVQDNGGATFTNNGTVNATGGALLINTDNYNNAGTTEATNGSTLTLAANVTTTNTGKLIATGGGILDISGLLNSNTGNSINSVGGTVNILGATLLGTVNETAGSKLVFNTSGNNILNNTTVNGNLDLATDPTAYLRIVNTDTLNGNLALGASGGNGLHLQDGSSNFVLNGNLTGFGGVVQDNGGATFTNNGTVNANSAAQTLNINTDHYNNAGTTEVQNGAFLSVTSANTDSGNVLVSTGGTATFSQGLTQTAGTTQVDGTLNSALTLTGGILKGAGTVVGNVVNNGGTIAPGDSPGKLAITGAFTQNSGTFSIEFNNTAHDVLAVSGLATTGGLLDVNYIGTGASAGVGSIFDILDYYSVATSLTGSQFFSNQGAGGLITGHNGFTYMLINDTTLHQLQLKELTAGNPVPETSSVVSLGLLLALGLGGLTVNSRRRKAVR